MDPMHPLLSVLFGLFISGVSALCWLPIVWLLYRVVTPWWKRSYARFTSWCVFTWIWIGSVYATAGFVAERSEPNGSAEGLTGLIPASLCGFGPMIGLAVSVPFGMWLRRRRGWGRPVLHDEVPASYVYPPANPAPQQVIHQHVTIVNQIIVQPPDRSGRPERQRPKEPRKLKRKRSRKAIDSKPDTHYDLDESDVRYWTEDD